jgi:hypothetical protein
LLEEEARVFGLRLWIRERHGVHRQTVVARGAAMTLRGEA